MKKLFQITALIVALFLFNCGSYQTLPLPLNSFCTWDPNKGDQDCAKSNVLNICLDGICIVKTCSNDADCPLGNKCENNECTTVNPCKTDQDCLEKAEPGQITSYCYNGKCIIQYCKPRTDCNQDDPKCYTECPENQECLSEFEQSNMHVCIFKKEPKACNPGETRPCYSANSGCSLVNGKFNCIAPCKTGVQICDQNGNWQKSCNGEIIPQKEICDNIDNDCNGKVDDDPKCNKACNPGETRPCYSANSGCSLVNGKFNCTAPCRTGVQICDQNGNWQKTCNGEITPQKEICDNIDNDCNGKVDDDPKCNKACNPGETRPCYSANSGCSLVNGKFNCTAPCRTGVQICDQNGNWQKSCNGEITPQKEICDNIDNDCNGKVDENLNCPCKVGTVRQCYTSAKGCYKKPDGTFKCIGECRAGTQFCKPDKTWSNCRLQVLPDIEYCNGYDDDCDGRVDEDFPKLNRPCYVGVGECRGTGKFICSPNRQQTICTAVAKPPKQEICDGKDNNCDGYIDENVTKECYPFDPKTKNVGICRPTYAACHNGKWGQCPPGAIGPQKELCNGKDDDCDGKKDEDFPNLKKTCYAGKYACTQRGYYLCTGDHKGTYCYIPNKIIPKKELCRNAEDEDCDGYTDLVKNSKGAYVYNKYCSPMKYLSLENRNTFVMGCDPQKDVNCDPKTEKKRTITFQRNAKKALYVSVYGANCYIFRVMMGYRATNCQIDDYPLTYITWHEAAAFANALSRRDKLQECFICNGTGWKIKCQIRFSDPKDYYSCTGYRLPTSAEYEWIASCAGKIKTIPNPVYNKSPISPMEKIPRLQTPNPCGIYNVVGNLYIWTADSCNTTKTTTNIDPIVYDPNSNYKIIRGGCSFRSKNKQDCFVYKQKCVTATWGGQNNRFDEITVFLVRTFNPYK